MTGGPGWTWGPSLGEGDSVMGGMPRWDQLPIHRCGLDTVWWNRLYTCFLCFFEDRVEHWRINLGTGQWAGHFWKLELIALRKAWPMGDEPPSISTKSRASWIFCILNLLDFFSNSCTRHRVPNKKLQSGPRLEKADALRPRLSVVILTEDKRPQRWWHFPFWLNGLLDKRPARAETEQMGNIQGLS